MTYFFVHIPKTSGTTFMEVLRSDPSNRVGYLYPKSPHIDDFEKRFRKETYDRLKSSAEWNRYNFIGGHFPFGIHTIYSGGPCKYIGVFREPVSHFISAYRAFLRMSEDYQNRVIEGNLSLMKMSELRFMHNMQTFFLSGLSFAEMEKDKERAYQTAVENIEKYFVGLYPTERFDEGLIYFQHKIGIKLMPYRSKNVAQNDLGETLSEQVVERINAINDVDIRLYAYLTKKFEREFAAIPFATVKTINFRAKNKLYRLLPAS